MVDDKTSGVIVDGQDNVQNKISRNTLNYTVPSNLNGITLKNGGNKMLAAPILNSGAAAGKTIRVSGNINSTPEAPFQTFPNTDYRIEFFVNDKESLEGQTFVGFAETRTDSSGNASFSARLGSSATKGQFVTATATVTSGPNKNNTSQFSDPIKLGEARESFISESIFLKYCNKNADPC